MRLALFDFDGTITNKDSFIKFIIFSKGYLPFLIGFFLNLPIIIAYKLRIISNSKAKEKIISYFFKGMSEKEFTKISKEYSLFYIKNILRKDALNRIDWHKAQGHKIIIISASIECWLKPWCDLNDLELISTKLEKEKGLITGKFSTKNCHGQEKVNRLKDKYTLSDYNHIYAYGDSSGDKELLEIANERFFKPFR